MRRPPLERTVPILRAILIPLMPVAKVGWATRGLSGLGHRPRAGSRSADWSCADALPLVPGAGVRVVDECSYDAGTRASRWAPADGRAHARVRSFAISLKTTAGPEVRCAARQISARADGPAVSGDPRTLSALSGSGWRGRTRRLTTESARYQSRCVHRIFGCGPTGRRGRRHHRCGRPRYTHRGSCEGG